MRIITCLIFLCIFSFKVCGQQPLIINKEGLPPMTFYTGEDYGGYDGVWDIIQNDEGLIYIGTTSGLYEFDGSDWRKVIENGTMTPRMFAKADGGRIYVAGHNMIGYLAPNSQGKMGFESLANMIPDDTEVGIQEYVWVSKGKVFFTGLNAMFVYDDATGTMQAFRAERMYPSFLFNDDLFVMTKDYGMHMYTNDTLVKAPHSDYFSGARLSEIIQFDNGSAVGISRNHDFHIYNKDTAYVAPFFKDQDLLDKSAYKIFRLSDRYNAISYLKGGLLITDKDWNPVLHFDESTGVGKEVHRVFLDKENNLWMGTANGVTVAELGASYSLLDQRSGISGYVGDMGQTSTHVYLTTTSGVFQKALSKSGKVETHFEMIKNSDIYNDDVVIKGDAALIRAYESIGQIRNGSLYEKLFKGASNYSEIALFEDTSWALSIGNSGHNLQVFTVEGSEWKLSHSIDNETLPKIINNLRFDHGRDVFWGSNGEIFFSFSLSENKRSIVNYRTYDDQDGLPEGSYTYVQSLGEEVIFATADGAYFYNDTLGKFEKPGKLHGYFDNLGLYKIVQESDSVFVYSSYEGEMGKMIFAHDDSVHFRPYKVRNLLPANALPLMSISGKGNFFGGSKYLGFIQDGKEEVLNFHFTPLIRQFDLTAGTDTTVFMGVFTDRDSTYGFNQKIPLHLEPFQNSVRISYSMPYYRHPEKRDYQYQLVGFEDAWSEWTDKTEKEYTNLPPGAYTFKVKARNGFLTESEVGTFAFVIETPWHQTLWMYGVYLLLLVGLVYLIVDWNSQRLKEENLKLEGIIEDRTKEIRDQKEIIEKALVERESLLKEIHHRVKNNLQIIASLLYLQSGKFENEDFKKVLEEGQGRVRSMALIHQKLYENDDLKSIPFGEYLTELLSEIKASFGHAMEKVKLDIQADDVQFDVETAVPLGLIVNELATNAFKYAFDGLDQGSFSIALTKEGEHFVLSVSDNGKGIPSGIDIKKTRSLGLRLVKMLSVQLEAEYAFESQEGTHFTMKFAA
ncbi:MAG: histidine kinase dimerization/phosphoacceptor domain -containing protein [Cyclobacteriaceae bacterium]